MIERTVKGTLARKNLFGLPYGILLFFVLFSRSLVVFSSVSIDGGATTGVFSFPGWA